MNTRRQTDRENPIIRRLKADHRRFAHLIRHMEWTMARCRHGEGVDADTMKQFVAYCSEHADHHHHPLEDRLFACMVKREPGLATVVKRMESEHVQLHKATDRLDQLLGDMGRKHFVPRSEFLDALESYLALYHQHMLIEESELFARMEETLTAQDWEAVTAWLAEQSPSPFDDPHSHQYQTIERLLAR